MSFLSLLGYDVHRSCYLLFRRLWSFILMTHNRKSNDTWGLYVLLSHLPLRKGLYKKLGSAQLNIELFK